MYQQFSTKSFDLCQGIVKIVESFREEGEYAMIVDYLIFTFADEHEDNLPGLVKKIDPGAVALETRTGYTHDWSLWGNGRLKWGHPGEAVARLSR